MKLFLSDLKHLLLIALTIAILPCIATAALSYISAHDAIAASKKVIK